jgi:hypothetical protein
MPHEGSTLENEEDRGQRSISEESHETTTYFQRALILEMAFLLMSDMVPKRREGT